MANRKVLITGASGLLGRAVYQAFQSDSSWQTLGQAYSRAKGGLLKVDLTQPEDVHKMVLDTMVCIVVFRHHGLYCSVWTPWFVLFMLFCFSHTLL